MNRSILALMIGAFAIVACNAHVSPSTDDAEALEQGADKGDGGSDKGDPGDPGKGDPGKGDPGKGDPGDPGKGDPGKGGCDGGGKGGGPSDGGSCSQTVVEGCVPVDVAKQLPFDKCPPGSVVGDIQFGDPCAPDGFDGVSFTCCPSAPPPPPSTCFKIEISPDICQDWEALKAYAEKCDASLEIPSDPCAPGEVLVCCISDASDPPPKK